MPRGPRRALGCLYFHAIRLGEWGKPFNIPEGALISQVPPGGCASAPCESGRGSDSAAPALSPTSRAGLAARGAEMAVITAPGAFAKGAGGDGEQIPADFNVVQISCSRVSFLQLPSAKGARQRLAASNGARAKRAKPGTGQVCCRNWCQVFLSWLRDQHSNGHRRHQGRDGDRQTGLGCFGQQWSCLKQRLH